MILSALFFGVGMAIVTFIFALVVCVILKLIGITFTPLIACAAVIGGMLFSVALLLLIARPKKKL